MQIILTAIFQFISSFFFLGTERSLNVFIRDINRPSLQSTGNFISDELNYQTIHFMKIDAPIKIAKINENFDRYVYPS